MKSVDFSLFPTLQASLSSTILQSCLHHWRGTLHLYAAVHQCCQRPPKGLGSNKTVEATQCRSLQLYNCLQCQEEWGAAQTACSQVWRQLHAVSGRVGCSPNCMQCQEESSAAQTASNVKKSRVCPHLQAVWRRARCSPNCKQFQEESGAALTACNVKKSGVPSTACNVKKSRVCPQLHAMSRRLGCSPYCMQC